MEGSRAGPPEGGHRDAEGRWPSVGGQRRDVVNPPAVTEQLLAVEIDYSYTGLGLGTMLASFTGPIVLSASTTMKNE